MGSRHPFVRKLARMRPPGPDGTRAAPHLTCTNSGRADRIRTCDPLTPR